MTFAAATLRLDDIETLAFAGGGNRCWWQAGLVSHLLETGWKLPPLLVATSAGAGVATSLLTCSAQEALRACKQLYSRNEKLFDWKALAGLRLRFAHHHIYPAWIESLANDQHFEKLKAAGSDLLVAVTRPARALGLSGSLLAGSIAYLVDKKLAHSIHPRLPRYLGLRQEFLRLKDAPDGRSARVLLQAAAAAAPFMSAQRVNGRWYVDGGYTDNAPIPPQSADQKDKTLVLLTRHYPDLPAVFRRDGRTYWQPSSNVPVSTWDCRSGTTVDQAFDLGLRDAARLA